MEASQNLIDAHDQILDVENLTFEENSILSPGDTETMAPSRRSDNSLSGSSSQMGDRLDDFDPLNDFVNFDNDPDCVTFAEGLSDGESLDLCSYLVGARLDRPNQANQVSVVQSDLDLLRQRQEVMKREETIRNRVLMQVNNMQSPSSEYIAVLEEGGNQLQCMSKNAVAARENRQKKKQYVNRLENTIKALRVENSKLQQSDAKKEIELVKLRKEVRYLSNILANQSTLSSLLQNIHTTPNIEFSMLKNANTADKDSSCGPNPPRHAKRETLKRKHNDQVICSSDNAPMKVCKVNRTDENRSCKVETESKVVTVGEGTDEEENTGGICLHVTGKKVSIEFCADCNNNSKSSLIYSDHSYVRHQLSS